MSQIAITAKTRPDIVGRRMAKALERMLAKTSRGPVRVAILPEMDGSLGIRIADESGLLMLRWHRGDGKRLANVPGSVDIQQARAQHLEAAAMQALSSLMPQLLADPAIAPIAPIQEDLENGDVLRHIAENWIIPGQSGWFGFSCSDVARKGSELVIGFAESSGVRLRMAVGLSGAQTQPAQNWRVGRFAVRLLSDDRTGAQRKHPAHQVERLLAFVLLRQPERMQAAGETADSGELSASSADSSLKINAFTLPAELSWRQFMAELDLAHFYQSSWETTGTNSYVSHSDRGCIFMRPYLSGPLSRLINYPKTLTMSRGFKMRTTNLSDRDVITDGSEWHLELLMKQEAEQNPGPHAMILDDTCIPKLLGQDLAGVTEKFSNEHPHPVLQCFPGSDFGEHSSGLVELFRGLMQTRKAEKAVKRKSVALIGFTLGRDLNELRATFEALGVSVDALLLPNIDVRAADAWQHCAVQVLCPSDILQPTYDAVFIPGGVPVLQPAAPYGLEASTRFLGEVAQAAGQTKTFETWWQAQENVWREKQSRWREKAGKYRLGFVVDAGQMRRTFDPLRCAGLNLAQTLGGFGFKLAYAIFEPSGEADLRASLRTALHKGLGDCGVTVPNCDAAFFTDKAELDRWFAQTDTRLVFSEYGDDPRLLAAGKGGFSLGDFEKGLLGAERSVARLLQRCETSYFERLKAVQGGEK